MQWDNSYKFSIRMLRIGFLLLLDILAGCNQVPATNLSPPYEPSQFVGLVSQHETSAFVEVTPADDELAARSYVDPRR